MPATRLRLREREAIPGVRLLRAMAGREDFHRHTYRSILVGVVQRGRRRLCTPDGEFLLYPGNGFLLPSAMVHWSMVPEPHSYRVVSVLPGLWRELAGAHEPAQAEILPHGSSGLLAVRRLIATLRGNPDPLAVETCLLALHEAMPHADPAVVAERGDVEPMERDARVCRVRDWLDGHCTEVVRLATLAAIAGCGAATINREFGRAVGLPPYEYLLRQRLRLAAQRLRETDARLAEIAYATGFADPGHLRRGFVWAYGVTPDDYRRSPPAASDA